jgi:mono/diheme cytochrome c family protein
MKTTGRIPLRRPLAGLVAVVGLVAPMSAWLAAQELRGNPDRGEAIYKEHCLRCHGRHGDGQGPETKDVLVKPTDFHAPQSRARSDFELLIAISNGVLFSPMHSWRGRIADEDMLHVIAYVRALAPEYPHF